jgi:ATPase family AAA domain-containing protein 3A/B
MAKVVGLDYAFMSGGDVGPLGADGVTQIHSLFRWAKFSKKGVLLFIDEAEAFLSSRSKNAMSESAHNALNALLYNTGMKTLSLSFLCRAFASSLLFSAISFLLPSFCSPLSSI